MFFILVSFLAIYSKTVSERKKQSQRKRQFNQLDEILNEFVIGNGTTMKTMRIEGLQLQANVHHEVFGGIVDSASQNQVIGSNTDNRIRNEFGSAVIGVKNCTHGAILTAIKKVLIPRVEMAVGSTTGASRNGRNSLVQGCDRRDFTGNTENTPLRSASSRLDLNIEQDEVDETRDIDNSGDANLPATRINYDRRAHAHQSKFLKLQFLS